MFESFMKNFVLKPSKEKKVGEDEDQIFPDQVKEKPVQDSKDAVAQEEMRLAKMRSQEMFRQGRKNIENAIDQLTDKQTILPTYEEYKSGIRVQDKLSTAIEALLEDKTPKVEDEDFASARVAYVDLLRKEVVEPIMAQPTKMDAIKRLQDKVLYGGTEALLEQAEKMEKLKQEMQEFKDGYLDFLAQMNPKEIRARNNASEMSLAILQEKVFESLKKLIDQSENLNVQNEKNFASQFDAIKSIHGSLKGHNQADNYGGNGLVFMSTFSKESVSFNQVAEVLGIDVSQFNGRPLVEELHQAAGERPYYYKLPQNVLSMVPDRYPGVEVELIIDPQDATKKPDQSGSAFYFKAINNRG